jgi:hypothetical protein
VPLMNASLAGAEFHSNISRNRVPDHYTPRGCLAAVEARRQRFDAEIKGYDAIIAQGAHLSFFSLLVGLVLTILVALIP